MVMIGIDPHKRTHTAVAIDNRERVLDERLVRATGAQVPELLEWAKRLDGGERLWAIESAGGLGYLLAQQLLAAGEHVVDIPATLASRVRLLGSGRSEKNDPNDARSVAIAALRATELVPVRVEDHATILRPLSRRYVELGWAYNKTACRFHALVADLIPGGIGKEVVVSQARSLLAEHQPAGTVALERHAMVVEMLDELERLNVQRKTLRRRIGVAVTASGTTVTEVFGIAEVGAVVILARSVTCTFPRRPPTGTSASLAEHIAATASGHAEPDDLIGSVPHLRSTVPSCRDARLAKAVAQADRSDWMSAVVRSRSPKGATLRSVTPASA